jgi:hypothetical protein
MGVPRGCALFTGVQACGQLFEFGQGCPRLAPTATIQPIRLFDIGTNSMETPGASGWWTLAPGT